MFTVTASVASKESGADELGRPRIEDDDAPINLGTERRPFDLVYGPLLELATDLGVDRRHHVLFASFEHAPPFRMNAGT